jgi:hypothetical protein
MFGDTRHGESASSWMTAAYQVVAAFTPSTPDIADTLPGAMDRMRFAFAQRWRRGV